VAYELRQKGWSYAAIGREFDISSPRARQLVRYWELALSKREAWAKQDKIVEEAERQFEEAELKFLSNYIDAIKELAK
jgi:hypothetical protein